MDISCFYNRMCALLSYTVISSTDWVTVPTNFSASYVSNLDLCLIYNHFGSKIAFSEGVKLKLREELPRIQEPPNQ